PRGVAEPRVSVPAGAVAPGCTPVGADPDSGESDINVLGSRVMRDVKGWTVAGAGEPRGGSLLFADPGSAVPMTYVALRAVDRGRNTDGDQRATPVGAIVRLERPRHQQQKKHVPHRQCQYRKNRTDSSNQAARLRCRSVATVPT